MMKRHILPLALIVLLLVSVLSLAAVSLADGPAILVKISDTELEMNVGAKKNLTLTYGKGTTASSLTIEWTSGNPEVAEVDGKGRVTAVGAGEATINCSVASEQGEELTLTCLVTVRVPVTALVSEEKAIQVNPGQTGSIPYTIEPEDATVKALEWSSANEEIATVDENGVVTAAGTGKTKVTAKTTDGSKKTLTWDVIVPTVYAEQAAYEIKEHGSFQVPVVFTGEDFDAGYTVEASGSEIEYEYAIEGNRAVFTVVPLAAGEAHLVITDRKNAAYKADIRMDIANEAFWNPELLVITGAEIVPGAKVLVYKFDLVNRSSIEIGEIGFLVDYRDQFGDTHYLLANTDGSIANHKYTTMFNILPGETRPVYGQNEAFRANDLIKEVRVAICYYRFLTGQKVYIPDSQLFWVSTKTGPAERPEVRSSYEQPDEDTMDRAARVNIGATTCELYSYVVKDFSRSKRPGIFLASIADGGNASSWGLQRGDVIYGADNILWADDPFVLDRAMCDIYDGLPVTLKIVRNGEEKEITLARK